MILSTPPGVVIKSKFVFSSNKYKQNHRKAYDDYIKYIERKEAVNKKENDFSSYQDYMANEEKTTALFTKDEDHLSPDGKKKLKKAFLQAQKNGSVMWQDVISFNNDWLEKHGIYDSKTKILDEKKIKEVTRSAMEVMMEKENLSHTAIWSAAIHYNTDNIHVHIAMCEPFPSKERIIQKGKYKGLHRGGRKKKSIEAMKATVINKIMDRGEELKKIDELIRKNIVKHKKEKVSLLEDKKTKKLFLEIMRELPKDKRQWKYNYNSLKDVRPKIDQLSTIYLQKYHKKEFEELKKRLMIETELKREAYGEGDKEKNRYLDYYNNKIQELYTRLGNAILAEMRNYDTWEKQHSKNLHAIHRSELKIQREKFRENLMLRKSFRRLNYIMNSEYESWKNQRAYEELQEELER